MSYVDQHIILLWKLHTDKNNKVQTLQNYLCKFVIILCPETLNDIVSASRWGVNRIKNVCVNVEDD